MTKTLYLLRHAKSSWKDISLSDFDRPLNKRGKHDAPFMAEKMRAKGIRPQLILSSPAKRAKKTAKTFSDILEVELHLDKKLYEGNISEMLEIIEHLFEHHDEVMIVAHNPELTMINDILSNKEIFNIPTTGIVAIVFNHLPTQKSKGRQLFFEYPKKFGEKK